MNETIAGRQAPPDNPFESSARAMSEFVIRAAILPGTLFLSKPHDIAAGATSGDYRLLPSPYLLALITGVVVSGVTSNLDKFQIPQPGQQAAATSEPSFLKAVIDFYMDMDGVQAILFALPFIFVLWFLAAGLSLCMRRNIDETPTLFATLSWSLATLVAITILAALGSFLIGTDQAVFGAVLFFGSLAFALIVAVKTVRTVLALRKQRGSPLVGAIIASIFAFAVVFFAGAAGALMSGLVYSQRVLVREIYSAEAEGRRTEAMYRAADFVQARDFDSAIVEFSKAIEADPDYARGYADRAGAFTQKRDFAAALNDMDEAIRLDGENPAYLGGRCMLKVSMAEALPAADAPAEQKAGDQAAEPDQKQALVQSAQGDCSRALELAPGSVEVLDQRARIHLSLREFEAALADYEAVLKTQPDSLPALYGRGLALRGLGKTKDGDRDMAAAAARDAAVAAPFKALGFDPPSAGAPAP